MMLIVLFGIGIPVLWCFGTGYTVKLLDRETKWTSESFWPASCFIWPILLLGIWGIEFQTWLANSLDARKKVKSLPPIQIKPGAKITDWDQYSQLVGLCTEFEAKNGIDNRSLLERNP